MSVQIGEPEILNRDPGEMSVQIGEPEILNRKMTLPALKRIIKR
jgi:hypothetical protein